MLRIVHNVVSFGGEAGTQMVCAPIYDQRHWYARLDAPGAREDVRDAQPNAHDHHDGLYDERYHHEPHCGFAAKVHGEHWGGHR